MTKIKFVPPDGGYAWIIAGAFSIHHIIAIPLGHTFGLIFKDKFRYLGFSATDIAFIVNTNAAVTFWCGVINGVLLKLLGYRKVAFIGALLMTGGLFLTAYAETFTQYMVFYGVITAIGMGMGISAYPLAVNTYFKTKRTKAFGYAMTVSGFGPVLLPQLVSLLLFVYGEKGTVIILSGYAAHAFISSLLLQPVKRHMVKEELVEDDYNREGKEKLLNKESDNNESRYVTSIEKTKSLLSLADAAKIESTYHLDASSTGSVLSVYEPRQKSVSFSLSARETPIPFHRSISDKPSASHKRNSAIQEHNGTIQEKNEIIPERNGETTTNMNDVLVKIDVEKAKSKQSTFLSVIINLFDLTLLKDWTFVNIIAGIALGICSEKSFSLLIPFIMQDYNLDTQEIATFMSTLSVTDICFRFVAPYVSDLFKKPVRVMYIWSVLLLIIFRCGLFVTNNYTALLICGILIGFARGFRTIYWMLILPNYVPIERLASASGLQSVLNGIVIWLGAPLLGSIKDVTGSFRMCILVLNFVSFLNIFMWVVELAYKNYKQKMTKSTSHHPVYL